jgi:hypothetical protein
MVIRVHDWLRRETGALCSLHGVISLTGFDVKQSCLDGGNSRLVQSQAGCYATGRLGGQDYEIAHTLATSLVSRRRSIWEE